MRTGTRGTTSRQSVRPGRQLRALPDVPGDAAEPAADRREVAVRLGDHAPGAAGLAEHEGGAQRLLRLQQAQLGLQQVEDGHDVEGAGVAVLLGEVQQDQGQQGARGAGQLGRLVVAETQRRGRRGLPHDVGQGDHLAHPAGDPVGGLHDLLVAHPAHGERLEQRVVDRLDGVGWGLGQQQAGVGAVLQERLQRAQEQVPAHDPVGGRGLLGLGGEPPAGLAQQPAPGRVQRRAPPPPRRSAAARA
ncbi:hypothetical protein AQJ66_25785 [Streptomyces bungoensis]|uniref:Uncharacterized protein n=1 Tax=Streptomyces bungoensis TaxID=285568 RepID=A0A101SUP8_9ACTN|nr:hypothetical protein AQJ66_25785 [Streptomyces bungoensis]